MGEGRIGGCERPGGKKVGWEKIAEKRRWISKNLVGEGGKG